VTAAYPLKTTVDFKRDTFTHAPSTGNTHLDGRALSFRLGNGLTLPPRLLSHAERPETFTLSDSLMMLAWSISLNLKHEVTAVSLREMLTSEPERAMKLFDACYALYCAAFTDPNERQSADILLRALQRESKHWDIIAIVEGDRVLGARHMTLLQSDYPEIGLFVAGEHVYVDENYRSRGMATVLISHTEQMMRSWGARVAISEQNDPNVMTPEMLAEDGTSGITTQRRLEFWRNRGYEGIDAPYVQPPLEEGTEPVYHLRIAIRRLDPTFPTTLPTEGYLQMLKVYQSTWLRDFETNPLVSPYFDAIRREHPERIPIIDLRTPRTCVQ